MDFRLRCQQSSNLKKPMFGELLGSVVRIVNAPIRAAEDLMAGGHVAENDRILSKPADLLADELEDIDE